MDDVRTELIGLLAEEFERGGIPNTTVGPTLLADGTESPAQMMVPLADESTYESNDESADGDGDPVPTAHVYFLPALEHPPVVQIMVPLGESIRPGAEPDLARFVALVNANLPVTGFEISETLGMVVFRHTQAVSTAPLDPAVIAWPLTMIRFAVEHYGPLVAEVAAGCGYQVAAARFEAGHRELIEG